MLCSTARRAVVDWACLLSLATLPSLTVAQSSHTPSPGFLGQRCEGYRGVEGKCNLVNNCPALSHDLKTLPLPTFVERHGPNCALDLTGDKLVCCPNNPADLSARSCGRSKLSQYQRSGKAHPGAWPWLAYLYLNDEYGWTPVGCYGVLISDRHVLIDHDCAGHPVTQVLLGQYLRFNFSSPNIQNISSTTAVRDVKWSDEFDFLAVMVLEKPAVLQPDVVWPVCLTDDPLADLGYDLDGLGPSEKQLGFLPYWPGSLNTPLHQTQAFYSNCSIFCEPDETTGRNATIHCPTPSTLCVGGLSVNECKSLGGNHGQPFVVTSAVTGEFFLAGMTRSAACYSDGLNYFTVPILPYAKQLLHIIQ